MSAAPDSANEYQVGGSLPTTLVTPKQEKARKIPTPSPQPEPEL
ncbi:MAG TPA: hypothetical protein V6D14_32775 [Coleofasciculaceae cyanobacterium]